MGRNLLESNPSQEYLDSELKRLNRFIDEKSDQYLYWKKNVAPKNLSEAKLKSLFNREVGISEAKKHVKSIKYILSNG